MHMNQTEMFMKPCVNKEDVVDPRHYVFLNTGLVGHWLPTPKTLFLCRAGRKASLRSTFGIKWICALP